MIRYRWRFIGAFGIVILVATLVLTRQGLYHALKGLYHALKPTATDVPIYEPDYSFTPSFSPSDFEAAFKRNQILWDSKSISHYTISVDLSVIGYDQSPWIVEVETNKVVSITGANGKVISPSEITNYEGLSKKFLTIPGLFSFVEQTYREQRPMLRVEYDSTFGYPNNIYVDPWAEPCCQDYWLTVGKLHILP